MFDIGLRLFIRVISPFLGSGVTLASSKFVCSTFCRGLKRPGRIGLWSLLFIRGSE